MSAAPAPGSSPGTLVFVTSWAFPGNFGGLAKADEHCNMIANRSTKVPPGTYTAWLSDSTVNAKERINQTGPYVLLGGELIAPDLSRFSSGGYRLIHTDENGGGGIPELGHDGSHPNHVWTGTNNGGTGSGHYCGDWKSGGTGTVGSMDMEEYEWTDNGSPESCNWTNRFYCVQD